MLGNPYQIHYNDRLLHARRLGLSLPEFDRLLSSANKAYEVIKDLGPFYGDDSIEEPTFRITAEPVDLPKGSKLLLSTLGGDLVVLGKALQNLPKVAKAKLGENAEYTVPPTWRIDAILDEHGRIKINEIEGLDGATALMMAEQFAYSLQIPQESTAAKMVEELTMLCRSNHPQHRIGLIRTDVSGNQTTPNARRFISFVQALSNGRLYIDHLDENMVRTGIGRPNFRVYCGILNETSLSPKELFEIGVEKSQLLTAGNYSALVNKGVFALLFDETLREFWENNVGIDRLNRLQSLFIPSKFIKTAKELEIAKKEGKVVKISWAGTGSNILLINRSRGVAMPQGNVPQSSEERWEYIKELLKQGVILIAQDFVKPAKIHAYLRKRSTNLEPVDWYNRLCVKYVCKGDPNGQTLPQVLITASEITLGPDIIPAGRKCAFTAGRFED